MPSKISLKVSLKKNSLDAVRYAAHSMGGAAFAWLKPLPGGQVLVELSARPGRRLPAGLARAFSAELEDERLREKVSAGNRDLREFMLLKALNYRPAPPQKDDAGLTVQQEKELNDLIAQIESEIKAEASTAKSSDPLGITRTWEDRYESKNGRKKKR